MEIWVPLHYDKPGHALCILIIVGEPIVPGSEGSQKPLDEPSGKFIEDEWARVPGWLVQDLTAEAQGVIIHRE